MARQSERSPLLRFPAQASHFAAQGGRAGSSTASAPPFSSAAAPPPPPPARLPPPGFVLDDADDAEVPHYSFAPHEHAVLYDEDEEETEDGGAEDDDEAAPTLQRVDNSARLNGRGGSVSTHAHAQRGRGQRTGDAPHSGAVSYGSTAGSHGAAALGATSSLFSHGHGLSSSSTPAGSPVSSADASSSLPVKELDGPSRSPSPSALLSSSGRPAVLVFYLCLSVLIAAANSITWKRTLNRFRAMEGAGNFEVFVTQLSILLYVLLAAVILAYRWLCTELISDEQKTYSQYKFLAMGLMDAIAGMCSSLGGAFTSGQVQVIVNQANIPVTMLLSRSFLRSSYVQRQYMGAALIVAGSLLAVLPSTTGQGEVAGLGSSGTLWYGPLILLLSTLPNSFSNVYKEHNFKQDGLDVFFLTTNVSIYQVLLGFLFCPLQALPALGGLSLSQVPHNFSQGWSCFLGREVDGYLCHVAPHPWVVFLLYVVVNFAYNVLLLLITKEGSALLLVIASALSLPITNLVFTLPLFMGKEAEQWSWWTVSGLLVVVVGFLLYSLVTDDDSGEWLPVQGAAGQVVYIAEEPVAKSLARHQQQQLLLQRPRRHSFDMTSSPLLIARVKERKKKARRRFMQQHHMGRPDGMEVDEQGARLFFTPP